MPLKVCNLTFILSREPPPEIMQPSLKNKKPLPVKCAVFDEFLQKVIVSQVLAK